MADGVELDTNGSIAAAMSSFFLALFTGILYSINTFIQAAPDECTEWSVAFPFYSNGFLFFWFGVGSFAAGFVFQESRSPLLVIAVAVAVEAACFVASASAIRFCNQALFLASFSVLGVAGGFIFLAGVSITMSWFADHKRLASALFTTTNGAAIMILQATNNWLVASHGLIFTFYTMSVVVLTLGLLSSFGARFGPHHGTADCDDFEDGDGVGLADERTLCIGTASSTRGGRGTSENQGVFCNPGIFASPTVWLYITVIFTSWAPGWGILGGMDPMFNEVFGLDAEASTGLSMIPLSCSLVSRLIVGCLPACVTNWQMFSSFCAIQCLICGVFCHSTGANQVAIHIVELSMLAAVYGSCSSLYLPYAMDLFPHLSVAKLSGIAMLVDSLSAMYAIVLLGQVHIDTFFWIMAVTTGVGFIANLLLAFPSTDPRTQYARTNGSSLIHSRSASGYGTI
jgi:hypothetical protein